MIPSQDIILQINVYIIMMLQRVDRIVLGVILTGLVAVTTSTVWLDTSISQTARQ